MATGLVAAVLNKNQNYIISHCCWHFTLWTHVSPSSKSEIKPKMVDFCFSNMGSKLWFKDYSTIQKGKKCSLLLIEPLWELIMLYVVKLNALNDSPSLMGIEEHIPDVWKVCRECRCCWFQCSNVIFKVWRESVTRVPFLYSLTLFGMQPVVVGVRTRGVWDQWQLDSFKCQQIID